MRAIEPRAVAIAAISLGVAIVDLTVANGSSIHAALVAVVCLAAALATSRLLPRDDLAPYGAALPAAWSLVYRAEILILAAACLAALPALGSPSNRWLSASLAAAFAGAVLGVASVPPLVAVVAAAVAFVAVLLRPELPTRQQLGFLRMVSLFAPGLILVALVAANAATGFTDDLPVRQTVLTSLGLAGLVSLLGLAGLGQTTMLESRDPGQRHLWSSLSATLAVPVGLMLTGDPTIVLTAMPIASVPLAAGTAVAIARFGAENRLHLLLAMGVGIFTVLIQLSL